jgi:uncharacterized membrane protein
MMAPMIREHLIQAHPDRDGAFRWRGDGVSRIEGLSDAVFGFALALLVASLGVPRTYADLTKMLVSFPAFAATFWMLYILWSAQYKFFRRYGLEDARTVKLNVVLLLVVVFYVYPLMFLYNTFIAMWMGVVGYRFGVQPIIAQSQEAFRALRPEQWPFVMCVFAAGYVAVFGVFVLLHRHALALADVLDLDAGERLETRYAIREHALHIAIALLSVVVTLSFAKLFHWPPGAAGGMGGLTYGLTGPAMSLHFRGLRRARESLTVERVTVRPAHAS